MKTEADNEEARQVADERGVLVGSKITLRYWGGDGYHDVEGTVEAIEAGDDMRGLVNDGFPIDQGIIVIIEEDKDMAYFLSQVIETSDA